MTTFCGIHCPAARADGGVVRLMEQHGAYRICVFTAPNPLRAGPVDISVLVQDVATGQPVAEGKVEIELTGPEQTEPSIFTVATVDEATNKLLRAAKFHLPGSGQWHVDIRCTLPDQALKAKFEMLAAAPLPRWRSMWPWFTWPVVVIVLFGAYRHIVASRPAR